MFGKFGKYLIKQSKKLLPSGQPGHDRIART
jgi:hypothetical protein